MKLFNFGSERAAPASSTMEPILPEDVRYALQYRNAELARDEIGLLYRNFSGLGFYLTMKALEEDDEAQFNLLQEISDYDFDPAKLPKEIGWAALEAIPRDQKVKANKVEQVSRRGMDGWLRQLDRALDVHVDTVEPESPIVIIANGPYVGLSAIAKHSVNNGRRLGIVKPNRLDGTDAPIGFSIDPNSGEISGLDCGFSPSDTPTLFYDDVYKSGDTMRGVIDYWESNNPSVRAQIGATYYSTQLFQDN